MKRILLIGVFAFGVCAMASYYMLHFYNKPIFTQIPEYRVFVNPNTIWARDTVYMDSTRRRGASELDTMVVLTKDYMLLITGQYCMRDDTIILPCDGYYGIHYEVLINFTHSFADREIKIGPSKFVRNPQAIFEWWDYCIPQIKGLGKGVVIVGGP